MPQYVQIYQSILPYSRTTSFSASSWGFDLRRMLASKRFIEAMGNNQKKFPNEVHRELSFSSADERHVYYLEDFLPFKSPQWYCSNVNTAMPSHNSNIKP